MKSNLIIYAGLSIQAIIGIEVPLTLMIVADAHADVAVRMHRTHDLAYREKQHNNDDNTDHITFYISRRFSKIPIHFLPNPLINLGLDGRLNAQHFRCFSHSFEIRINQISI